MTKGQGKVIRKSCDSKRFNETSGRVLKINALTAVATCRQPLRLFGGNRGRISTGCCLNDTPLIAHFGCFVPIAEGLKLSRQGILYFFDTLKQTPCAAGPGEVPKQAREKLQTNHNNCLSPEDVGCRQANSEPHVRIFWRRYPSL